jgi:ribonuclease VapC
MTNRFVLDAWAILAFLQKEEPAASRVKALLEHAERREVELLMSIINLGEVVYRVGKVRGEQEAQETLDELRRLPLTIISVTDETVFSAVRFKINFAISYADAFAAAIADRNSATLVTGDPELEQLGDRILLEKLSRSQ